LRRHRIPDADVGVGQGAAPAVVRPGRAPFPDRLRRTADQATAEHVAGASALLAARCFLRVTCLTQSLQVFAIPKQIRIAVVFLDVINVYRQDAPAERETDTAKRLFPDHAGA